MGLNLLSTDIGYKGVAVTAGAGAVISATAWIRRLPAHAPLVRYSIPVLLTMAWALTAITLLVPEKWAGVATLAAAGLTIAAILIAASLEVAWILLAAAATIGAGVAAIGGGASLLHHGDGVGVATIIAGGTCRRRGVPVAPR